MLQLLTTQRSKYLSIFQNKPKMSDDQIRGFTNLNVPETKSVASPVLGQGRRLSSASSTTSKPRTPRASSAKKTSFEPKYVSSLTSASRNQTHRKLSTLKEPSRVSSIFDVKAPKHHDSDEDVEEDDSDTLYWGKLTSSKRNRIYFAPTPLKTDATQNKIQFARADSRKSIPRSQNSN